jgi:small subunit ribosomal protein S20
MPNTKSAAKELRKAKKRTQKNSRVKNNIKTLLKKIDKALLASDKKTVDELFKKVQSSLDKASKYQIIKKNTAGRKKSRLLKKINKTK